MGIILNACVCKDSIFNIIGLGFDLYLPAWVRVLTKTYVVPVQIFIKEKNAIKDL